MKIKNIHIENSYNIWSINAMYFLISYDSSHYYGTADADVVLNRSWKSMYIEWWIHNIGYYLTLPFIKNDKIKSYNERFKHVDLEEHMK